MRLKPINKSILFAVGLWAMGIRLSAQPLPNEQMLYINKFNNQIGGKEKLEPIFQKLYLCNEPSCLISVLHIGDSHIKSKFYSLALESELNLLFNQLGHVYKLNDSSFNRKTYFFNLQPYAVIGTRFQNYYQSLELVSYLQTNKPDLVIISLGTNDAYSGIAINTINEQMKGLIDLVKNNSPTSTLLFTTPPDELKYIPTQNGADRIEEVRQCIMQQCLVQGIPYWNLYAVMGGRRQMKNWQRWGFANADNVHYTANGYTLFGRLLATAIFESYKMHF